MAGWITDLPTRTERPLVLVDEDTAQPAVFSMLARLEKQRAIPQFSRIAPQLRITDAGERVLWQGIKTTFRSLPVKALPNSKLVRKWFWPDTHVVCDILAAFLIHHRIVVLSSNTRNDAEGLRRLLDDHVRPALNHHHMGAMGLLVLMKGGNLDYAAYAAHVERRLAQPISRGYSFELVA